MIIYPTLTRYSVCNRLIRRTEVSTILCQQYKFVIEDVICYIVLYTICTIIWIRTSNSIFCSDRYSFAIEDFTYIF